MRNAKDLPKIGDRVRFRECSVAASGVIVDEFGDDYVRVQWTDVPTSTTHRRRALQIDRTAPPSFEAYNPS